MIFLLYLSLLLITGTALWAIISLPKQYMFKAFYIPVVLITVLLLYYTYHGILGYATKEDPPKVMQYLHHEINRDTDLIYLLIVAPGKNEPRMYVLPYNKELEKKLKGNQKARGLGIQVYGKLKRNRSGEENRGKWIWYDMAPADLMPKDYNEDENVETSENGIELIKSFEGRRLVAYQDSVGVWTIGYGHTKTAREDRLIIKSTADRLLAEDLAEFEKYVEEYVEVSLTQNQFDALVSWTFNLGPGNLQESTMLRKLNQGLYAEVPDEMRRWNKAGGKVLKGLVRRRDAEAELFNA